MTEPTITTQLTMQILQATVALDAALNELRAARQQAHRAATVCATGSAAEERHMGQAEAYDASLNYLYPAREKLSAILRAMYPTPATPTTPATSADQV